MQRLLTRKGRWIGLLVLLVALLLASFLCPPQSWVRTRVMVFTKEIPALEVTITRTLTWTIRGWNEYFFDSSWVSEAYHTQEAASQACQRELRNPSTARNVVLNDCTVTYEDIIIAVFPSVHTPADAVAMLRDVNDYELTSSRTTLSFQPAE